MSRFLRICSQSSKKVLIWPKKKFFLTKSKKVSKNAEFHADFESVKKGFKKLYQKKVISKNVTEKCTFFTFTHVRQTCFAYNFFCAFFHNFFNGFEISVKFCVFWHLFWFFSTKIFLKVILVLFSNFDCKCAGNGSKKRKIIFLWMYLRI